MLAETRAELDDFHHSSKELEEELERELERTEKAQQELDRVVGRDRLPTFEDRPTLPYITNVVKETLRWKAVSPLGEPRT